MQPDRHRQRHAKLQPPQARRAHRNPLREVMQRDPERRQQPAPQHRARALVVRLDDRQARQVRLRDGRAQPQQPEKAGGERGRGRPDGEVLQRRRRQVERAHGHHEAGGGPLPEAEAVGGEVGVEDDDEAAEAGREAGERREAQGDGEVGADFGGGGESARERGGGGDHHAGTDGMGQAKGGE